MPAILFFYISVLVAGTILFGWNLAELNAPRSEIQDSLGLSAAQFGLASSILAIGGLFGSIISTPGMNAFGRKKVLLATALVFGLGGVLKASAGGAAALTIGRFFSGMSSGSAAVIVPIYINELAPPGSRGAFGALTQISINLGILSSQVLGIFLEKNEQWRLILLIGGIIGLGQAAALVFLPESPSSLVAVGEIEQARKELIKIRGTEDVEEELSGYESRPTGGSEEAGNTNALGEDDPLLEARPNSRPEPELVKIGLLEFATKREYRFEFMVVTGVMLAQQLTGINSVVFYGVSILDGLLPDSAKYLNAAISAVNLFVTLGASFLFDRVSHRLLLITSMFAMAFFSFVLATSIKLGLAVLSALATLFFVSSFSVGLGPLPWMVAARRLEPKAVGAAQSIALTANWMGTFLVSFAVPVIADVAGMPVVFAIFGILGLVFAAWGTRCL